MTLNDTHDSTIEHLSSHGMPSLPERDSSDAKWLLGDRLLEQLVAEEPDAVAVLAVDSQECVECRTVRWGNGQMDPLALLRALAILSDQNRISPTISSDVAAALKNGNTSIVRPYTDTVGQRKYSEVRLARIPGESNKRILVSVVQLSESEWIQRALWTGVERTASTTGDAFFNALTAHLASVLNVRHVFVTECVDQTKTSVQMLAFWTDGEWVSPLSFDLAGTTCERVIAQGLDCHYPRDVEALFPQDDMLPDLDAQSYLGVPLFGTQGDVLGHIAAVHSTAQEDYASAMVVLKHFARRAGAELERRLAERMLSQYAQRLEALREIDRGILVARSPESLAAAALAHIREVLDVARASLAIFDYEGDQALVLGLSTDYESEIGQGVRIPLDYFGSILTDVKPGIPRIVTQIDEENTGPQIENKLVVEGVHSYMNVPLIAHGELIGSLNLGSTAPGLFSPVTIEIATEIADMLAVAIHNQQLFEAEQRERILAQTLQSELGARIEELNEAQKHLVRSTRVAAAGEIALGVAHQINNPLTTIVGQSQLLLNKMSARSPYRSQIALIAEAAQLAGNVVDRMHNLTRTRSFELTSVDINASLQRAISLVSPQLEPLGTRVLLELDSALPQIQASLEHLEDVWLNLLVNAKDAIGSRGDGKIWVSTTHLEDENMVEIRIEDNGAGIPQKHLHRIFDPFFTTKETGVGMGLSISFDAIARHGGTLSVESKLGRGTAFVARIPKE